MGRKSETALLRGKLARLAVENRELREMVSRLEAASSGRVAALEAENDRMRLEIAGRDRGTASTRTPTSRPRPVRARVRKQL